MSFLSMEFEIPLVSFIFISFLMIIFYSKERVRLVENKTYEVILITSFISAGFDTAVHVLSALTTYDKLSTDYYFIVDFINKVVATSFVVVFTCLLCYVLLISYRKLREKPKICWNLIAIISVVFFIIVNFTHVTITETDFARNTTGMPIIFAYFVVAVDLILAMILSIKNFKKNDKRYYTIFFITSMMVALYILSVLFRGLIIYDLVFALLCYIMYFTLENPDVQMINLLVRNKELVEQSVNDKSNFLFKISQEMRSPLKKIISNVKLYKGSKEVFEKDKIVNFIEQYANDAYFIINDITSISSADVKKIKMHDNRYMAKKLFTDIEVTAKNQLSYSKKGDDIKFNFKVLSKFPEYLYGDNIKLKQILLSIISNSIKYTNKGFIDVELDSITRYDVCRLVFAIRDSGCGMSITKINELLSSNEDMSAEEFQKNDSLDLKLPIAIKILKMLGGSISIRSEEGKGSVVIVVVDQMIENTKEEQILEDVKKYNLGVKVKKRVLVADDTPNLEKVERLLSKYDVDIVTTLVGRDVIDKIKSGDDFDLVLLRDDMRPDTAYSILKELREIGKFSIPVAIMINKDKEFIKEHFLNDGFSDCVVVENIDNEIKRIYDKYI